MGFWAQAPAGAVASDWMLDDAGVTLAHPLVGSRFAWAGLRDVREEKDRFVFLVTPMNNPVLPHRCLQPEQLLALRSLIQTVRRQVVSRRVYLDSFPVRQGRALFSRPVACRGGAVSLSEVMLCPVI